MNFSEILTGFETVLTPTNLLFVLIGVIVGMVIGVIPGLGPTVMREEFSTAEASWRKALGQ